MNFRIPQHWTFLFIFIPFNLLIWFTGPVTNVGKLRVIRSSFEETISSAHEMCEQPQRKSFEDSHKNIHDHTYSALLIYLHVLVGRLRNVSFEIPALMKLTDKGIQEKIRREFYEVPRRLLFNFNVSVFSKIAIFFFLQLSFNLKSSLPPVVESKISSNAFCLVTGTSLTIISSEEDNEPALD